MKLYYLDTSAALKLLREETHSRAFAQFYDSHPEAAWASSTLLKVELLRTVARVLPQAAEDACEMVSGFALVAIDDAVIDAAARYPDVHLRSLDAIHLATAREFGSDLTGVVTYDERLAAAAAAAGIDVVAPGQTG